MSLVRQLIYISRKFGPFHAIIRVIDATIAKIDDAWRTRLYLARTGKKPSAQKKLTVCVGRVFELDMNDRGLHRDLFLDRIREPVATSLMMLYVTSEDILLDAGANIGYFSILMAEKCKEVYAVEPDNKNYQSLISNINLNKIDNIKSFNLAFSNKDENLHLQVSEKRNWHRTVKINEAERSAENYNNSISATSVDSFCAAHGIEPSVLKMDIEGFERFVIPGAVRTLGSLKALFFELHTTHMTRQEANAILDIIDRSPLKIRHIVRYDRPGLWRQVPLSGLDRIRAGDYGIYELIYLNPDKCDSHFMNYDLV